MIAMYTVWLGFVYPQLFMIVLAFTVNESQAAVHAPRISQRPAVAARAPGLMIRAAINGPEITQSFVDAEAPSRQQGVYIDLINALFIGLNQFIPFLPALFEAFGGEEVPQGI